MRNPFVIVGHHRSGTSFLNSLMRAHPLIESMNEPLSQHIRGFLDWDLRPWHPSHVPSELVARPGVLEYLTDLQVALHADRDVVSGFKETCLTHKLGWTKAFFGEVSVVAVVRDPRATVASIVARNMHERWNYVRLLQAYSKLDERLPLVNWDDPIEVAAMSWRVRAADILSSSVRWWRLEDLIAEPTTLEGIMAEIGLTVHSNQYQFMRHSWEPSASSAVYGYRRDRVTVREGWRASLTIADSKRVLEISGEIGSEFGYAC